MPRRVNGIYRFGLLIVATGWLTIAVTHAPNYLAAAEPDQTTSNGEAANSGSANQESAKSAVATPTPKSPTNPTAELKLLEPDSDVWIDTKNKQVVMLGKVCLTNGPLEMFAVPKGTKEHESVVSIKTKAAVAHAALLAVGAKSGQTVRYQPTYQPATGDKIEILVFWTDDKGQQHKARAQDWVRDVKTKKAMTYPWVFAGSQFYVDEESKKTYYMAEAGDFICVSNFPDAMLDLPIESTSDNDELLFEAFTENIPPKGTKVTLVLIPQIEKKTSGGSKPDKANSK